jgi:hypothetical protein
MASVGSKRVLDVSVEDAEPAVIVRNPVPPIIASTDASIPAIDATPTTTPSSTVRPYVKKLKTKQEGGVPELVREIIAAQERFHSRMSPYDKAIQIFQERFMFGLTSVEEARLITQFSESDSLVRQFLSFNEEQRDVFVQEKKSHW